MGTFTFSGQATLQTSDGFVLSRTQTNVARNAKAHLDDKFTGGAIDIGSLMASITDPTDLLILAEGDGFKVNFDGLGASAKAYKALMLQVTPNTPGPAGLLVLTITPQGAEQRIRILSIGEPDA